MGLVLSLRSLASIQISHCSDTNKSFAGYQRITQDVIEHLDLSTQS